MKAIHTHIELVNTFEEVAAKRGIMILPSVKRVSVQCRIDESSFMLCINESIKRSLGLESLGRETVTMLNWHKEEYEIAGPVTIIFENRQTICKALVLPGNREVLLGSLAIKDMDVVINPRTQELAVNPAHIKSPNKPLGFCGTFHTTSTSVEGYDRFGWL